MIRAALLVALLAASSAAHSLPNAYGTDAYIRCAILRDQIGHGATNEQACAVAAEALEERCIVRQDYKGDVEFLFTTGLFSSTTLLLIIRVSDL